jgi:hypothetical protein
VSLPSVSFSAASDLALCQAGQWQHCAVYEQELERIWPLSEKDREAKIAQFAKQYGFRLAFYKEGLCAIFTPGGEA